MSFITKTITLVDDGYEYDISSQEEFKDLLLSLQATYLEHVATKRRILGYLSVQDGAKYTAIVLQESSQETATITPKRMALEEPPQQQQQEEESTRRRNDLPLPQKLSDRLNNEQGKEASNNNNNNNNNNHSLQDQQEQQTMVVSVSKTPRNNVPCHDKKQVYHPSRNSHQEDDPKLPAKRQDIQNGGNHTNLPRAPNVDSSKQVEQSSSGGTASISHHERFEAALSHPQDVHDGETPSPKDSKQTNESNHIASQVAENHQSNSQKGSTLSDGENSQDDVALLLSLRTQEVLVNDENRSPNSQKDPTNNDKETQDTNRPKSINNISNQEGIPLGEIPVIRTNVEDETIDSFTLQFVHRFLYSHLKGSSSSDKCQYKQKILEYRGLEKGAAMDRLVTKANKLHVANLKLLVNFFHIDKSLITGDPLEEKKDIVERLLEFAKCPRMELIHAESRSSELELSSSSLSGGNSGEHDTAMMEKQNEDDAASHQGVSKETNQHSSNPDSPSQIPRPKEWISPPRPKRRRLVLDPPDQPQEEEKEASKEESPTSKPSPKKGFTLTEYLVEAKALLDKGKYRLAAQLYEKALPLHVAALGPKHTQVAQTCFQLGRALRHLNRYQEAVQLHKRALNIRQELLDENDSRIADSYNAVAAVFHDLERYEDAMDAYEGALEIRLTVYGRTSVHVAQVLFNMGWIFQKLAEYQQAKEYYQQALSIYDEVKGEDHKLTQNTRNQIAQVNGQLNARNIVV